QAEDGMRDFHVTGFRRVLFRSIPRTNSARARSWLRVGITVPIESATKGWDIVVLKRGQGPQPGPEIINAPGHVGFYAGRDDAGRSEERRVGTECRSGRTPV